jgi:hypothetical protein
VLFTIPVRLNSTLRQHTAEIRLRPPVHKCNSRTAVQKYRRAISCWRFSAQPASAKLTVVGVYLFLTISGIQVSVGAPALASSLDGGSTGHLCDMKGAAFRPIQAR